MDALTGTKNGEDRKKQILDTPFLEITEELVNIIDPDYYDVKKEHLEALEATIQSFSSREVERLVK